MHAWDVITHGGGEGLVYVFNAVAAFFNGSSPNSAGSLAATLVFVSGAFGTAIATYTMVMKQEIKMSFNWLFMSFLLINCIMLPKVNVLIIDRITGLRAPVANVPFLLGAFAGIASQLGDAVTKQMDDIFSGPISSLGNPSQGLDVMTYRRHGVAMASQLVAKASRFTITDPDMAANIREFVQQCMVYDIAKGKYSIQELLASDDVWCLLKETASQARGFPYRTVTNGAVQNQILTCMEGAEKIESQWAEAYKHAKKIYGARFFPHSNDAAKTLAANLEISYEYLTQLSLQASDILRQNMMINAIEDGLLSYNQMTDASAAITGYAVTRAQEQQKTAYALEGKMASLALSVLKIVIEVVFYGIFPIIVVIAILPGGAGVLKKYIIALFWIQSWGPLYSILNMLVNTFGKMKSVGAITAYTGASLSAATLPGLAEANEWVAAVAGYAMMSVPFLSYGLIHYGAGALSQLATHFGSVTQSAASHAAEEATTGNYNMGNTNFDNHNRHNVSGFKHDTNSLVATGRSSVQMGDGSMVSSVTDGGAIFDRTGAISRVGGNMNFSQSISGSFSEMAEKSEQAGFTEAQSAQENITSAAQQMHDYKHSRGHGLTSDNTFSKGTSVMEQSAFSKYTDKVENFASENKISFEQANAVLATVSASLKSGIGVKALGAEMSVGGTLQNNETDTKAALMNKAINYSQKEGLSDLLQKSLSESNDQRFSQSGSENDTYSTGISAQLSEAQSHLNSATASYTKSQSLRDAAQFVNSEGYAFNQDLSQRYVNWLCQHEENDNQLGAQGVHHVLSDPEMNQRYMAQFVNEESANLYQDWEQHKQLSSTSLQENLLKNKTQVEHYNDIHGHFIDTRDKTIQKSFKSGIKEPINSVLSHQVDEKITQSDRQVENKREELKGGFNYNKREINKELDDKVVVSSGVSKVLHKAKEGINNIGVKKQNKTQDLETEEN